MNQTVPNTLLPEVLLALPSAVLTLALHYTFVISTYKYIDWKSYSRIILLVLLALTWFSPWIVLQAAASLITNPPITIAPFWWQGIVINTVYLIVISLIATMLKPQRRIAGNG